MKEGQITFEISLTWALVVCFISLLVFIYYLYDKKGKKK